MKQITLDYETKEEANKSAANMVRGGRGATAEVKHHPSGQGWQVIVTPGEDQ